MNRRSFSKTSMLASFAVTLIPKLTFGINRVVPTVEDLIGKSKPELFGEGYKLRNEAHESFIKMREAALGDGIVLEVVSSYRSFYHQKWIWDKKFNQNQAAGLSLEENLKKIIEYSTIPGTSRHHWGTELDIVGDGRERLNNPLAISLFKEGGMFYSTKTWLEEKAQDFGFYQAYTNDPKRKGFKYEPWHYSYKPISVNYLKAFLEIDLYELLIAENLEGSKGLTKEFISRYLKEHITDINPELLP